MSGTTTVSSSGLGEKTAVVAARRRLVLAVAVVLGVAAVAVTWVAPGILPTTAPFGAAVGVAALLLGVAAALAADAADLVVRGPRHVRAAGADVAAVVSRDTGDVGSLLGVVSRTGRSDRIRVGILAASRTAGAPAARATGLGRALAATGRRVLLTDMTRGDSGAAGLSDVLDGSHRLRDVVRFETGLYLGHVTAGADATAALEGYAEWADRLPSDLEVLVAALPPVSDSRSLAATRALDVVILQVEVDRTERVDLLASLDALDAAGVPTEVVLVDPSRRSRDPGPGVGGEDPDEGAVPDGVDETSGPDEPPATEVDGGREPDGTVAGRDDGGASAPDPAAGLEPDPEPHEAGVASGTGATVALAEADATVELSPVRAGSGGGAPDGAPATAEPIEERVDEEPVDEERDEEPDEPDAGSSGPDRWLDPRAVWSDLPAEQEGGVADEVGDDGAGDAWEHESPPPSPAREGFDDLGRDALTDEAVRATAALQALAHRVWDRDE